MRRIVAQIQDPSGRFVASSIESVRLGSAITHRGTRDVSSTGLIATSCGAAQPHSIPGQHAL